MSAFYGGCSECCIRRVLILVVLVDCTSMYLTVDALMELWKLLTQLR